MKKAISVLSFCVVAVLSMVGCSNSPVSLQNDNLNHEWKTTSTVSFSINLANIIQSYPNGLTKTSGNSLSASERKDLAVYRLIRATSLNITFFRADSVDSADMVKIKSNPFYLITNPVYEFSFPITSSFVYGNMAVDSGCYVIKASLFNDRNGEVSFYWADLVNVKEVDEVLNMCFRERFPVYATIAISNPKGDYTIGREYPLWFDTSSGIHDWGMQNASYIYSAVRGYILTYNVAVTEKGFKGTFTATNDKDDNGQSQTMIFDFNIMNMVWDGYVDLSPKGLTFNASFVMNQPPAIDSVFPTDGATNVPTDIQNIVAYFNKDLADLSDMPGAQFGIASEDGSHQISGTYGLSANIFSRQLTTTSERVYLKPNTKYVAHVSLVKDEYGNEMVGEKRWSFTTGN
jgi:hypothetical protein